MQTVLQNPHEQSVQVKIYLIQTFEMCQELEHKKDLVKVLIYKIKIKVMIIMLILLVMSQFQCQVHMLNFYLFSNLLSSD